MRAMCLSLVIFLANMSPMRAASNPRIHGVRPSLWGPCSARPEVLQAARGGDGAAERQEVDEPVAGWLDPDLLDEECEDCVCALCFGVMAGPASGCPEGHSFCRVCYGKALRERTQCPTCRQAVAGESKLVRNRPLEGIIAKLRVRCEHGAGEKGDEGAGPSAAKRAKLAPAASTTVGALRKQLKLRGQMTKGSKDELVARLEEDRMKGAGCGWRGCVGGRAAHLGECEWAPVKCRNQGCTESPLRRDLAEHDAFCGRREVECSFCERLMVCRSLAEHEGSCPRAKIECPNEGCGVQYTRGIMNVHRKGCEHEEVACPCPGCDARLLRKNMDAHLEERHLQGEATRPRLFSALKLLQRAWSRIALLEATAESEQSHAASSPTPEEWVFNWRADGWEMGTFKSERHTFRGEVEGWCTLQSLDSHFIGFGIERDGKCRVHATFSILDKHDKTLRQVCELGTATEPYEINGRLWGHKFTPTAEEKAQSVRADGSIRLRAVVRSSPTPRRRRGGGGGVGVRDGTEKALGERAAHGRVGVGD